MHRYWTFILVAVVTVVALAELARTVDSASALVSGPGYASAVGPAFQPKTNATQFEYFEMQVRTTSGTGGFVAPISLPDGAQMNEMKVLGYDDDPVNTLTVTFKRAYGGRGFVEQIATLTSAGASGDFELATTTDSSRSVVDNSTYGYFVELQLPAPSGPGLGLVLSRVRVGYAYGTHLPLVVK